MPDLPQIRVRMMTDAEFGHQLLLRDAKAFLRNVAIPRRRVLGWLYDRFAASKAQIVDENNVPVGLINPIPFENAQFDLWYRGWIAVQDPHVQIIVRSEAHERVRLLISLLRAIFPKEAATWGRPIAFFRELPNTYWMPTP